MIVDKIEAAMSKLIDETGLECNCITLHPEHHAQLIEEFREQVNVDPAIEEPIWYRGIPVYKAECRDDGSRNHLLEKGFSVLGHYDFKLDYYIEEESFPL